jgi:tetratricopeptide (TPR) repeat protein
LDSYQDGYNRGFEMGLSERTGGVKRQGYRTSSAEPIEYVQRINTSEIYARAKILKEAKAKAFELSKIGNYQGSIDIAKAGLGVLPGDVEFMMLIGNGYLQLRNYNEALKYLRKAENISHEGNLQKLISNIENGSYQKKIEEQEKHATNEQPKDNTSDIKAQISQYLKDKNYNGALDFTNKLIAKENSWQSYGLRGYIQYLLQNYPECVADYTKSININPTSTSYFFRALSKDKLQDLYGAINDYDKIIELGIPPDNNDMATIYNNKAYALVKLKKYNEALPVVTNAIELNQSHWYIWDTRGELYFQLGNYQKCIDDMTKAIELKPDLNSYYFRGIAKIKLDNKSGGCQDLSKSGELGNANAYIEIQKNCK